MHVPRSFPPAPATAAAPRPAGASGGEAVGPEFLTTQEAAEILRLSPRTLEKHRVLGGGPRFRKFGARVLYAAADVRAWADGRAYEMTSDPGCGQRSSVR
ncbi:helix-turn-helix transcriptional regulator [Variovorax sp.]|jgi:hypothetical protein|uniref:helix-turn-helix transcriptional regulator n=1 Tax=Variovorax sp. TaxID=1871043 RepID=UPI0037D9CDEF